MKNPDKFLDPDKPSAEEAAQWIAAAKGGDRDAMERLAQHVYPHVQGKVHEALARRFQSARGLTQTLFSTGDIVQDVIFDVLQKLDRFRGRTLEELLAFLTPAVTHRIVDTIRWHFAAQRDVRRDHAAASRVDLIAELRQETPSQIAGLRDEFDRVQRVLARLCDRERRLIELRFLEGATFDQIAKMLTISSADAARKALNKARARLLVRLKRA